jgi:quercetin 2,3-dioxygenase
MVEKIQQQHLDEKEVVYKNRSINKIINSLKTTEGDGFIVNRSFPTNSISYIDPFLLLDEMGPMDFKPGEAKGAPDHPHRGFETVTYLIDGIFEHTDSSGNQESSMPEIFNG